MADDRKFKYKGGSAGLASLLTSIQTTPRDALHPVSTVKPLNLVNYSETTPRQAPSLLSDLKKTSNRNSLRQVGAVTPQPVESQQQAKPYIAPYKPPITQRTVSPTPNVTSNSYTNSTSTSSINNNSNSYIKNVKASYQTLKDTNYLQTNQVTKTIDVYTNEPKTTYVTVKKPTQPIKSQLYSRKCITCQFDLITEDDLVEHNGKFYCDSCYTNILLNR